LFQNKVISDDRSLTPVQREEIAKQMYAAAAKILDRY
jgi:hypothetical protein